MEIGQFIFIDSFKEIVKTEKFIAKEATLVLIFADRKTFEKKKIYEIVKNEFSKADIVFTSTSGHFSNNGYLSSEILITAIQFSKTTIKSIAFNDNNLLSYFKNNSNLDYFLKDPKLKGLFVISEGSFINGTELINHLNLQTKGLVPVFGGIAADMERFETTLVGLNEEPSQGKIVLVGFYGNSIRFGFGLKGGWHNFGPEREVTKSEKNILYTIGNHKALDLYKEYLGEYAAQLPASSLFFPLSITTNNKGENLVRTVLSINEKNKSMTFAGEIPQGSFVKFMKSNTDNLLNAANEAALEANINKEKTQLVINISCVGRKIVLGSRHDEEFEIIKNTFNSNSTLCGFYSYGEIAPKISKIACDLNNQTVTITSIYEE